MKITAIKQQQRDENRVSIFVDGKYSFSLNLGELLEEKLKLGLDIDDARLKALKKKSDEGKLFMRCMEWLIVRPHSVREFRDYLRRKKVEPDQVEFLISGFEKRKLLDDRRFAAWLIDARSGKYKSTRALRAELRGKGVESSTIDEVLSERPVDEATALQSLITKKRRLVRYQDDTKLAHYLLRQGYGYSQVKDALNVQRMEDEEENDEA